MINKIIHSDCLNAMKEMEDNSINFIVTDSPYGVSFMSKHWDKQIPPHEYWKEMLRICKPGAYMACAGLPRMMHRLTSIVEDSGWIIRDMLIHIFGSGFPKSNNFGKKLGEPWNGYGTALKPAWEGWTLAMKPLDGTFAQNAEKWGIAGLNIDDCRIPVSNDDPNHRPNPSLSNQGANSIFGLGGHSENTLNSKGRWPANLILSEESAEELDKMIGILKSGAYKKDKYVTTGNLYKGFKNEFSINLKSSFGGASRFFYCAKASSNERNRGLEGKSNIHCTVKPISLMKYIITLLAPPGSPTCLDPFMGSGSTGVACKELGIDFIGIEKEKEYVEIAQKRIDAAKYSKQMEMF